MKRLMVLLSAGMLAACGVDGEPIQPSVTTNVGVGSNGVSAGVGTTIVRGKMSVHVGTSL